MNAWDTEGLLIAQTNYEQARHEFHQRIMLAHQNGMSLRAIAAITNVSHQTVANIISRHRAGTA